MALFSHNPLHFDSAAGHLDPDHHWRRSGHPAAWQPKFDIRETAEAFQLSGELPGMKKENVNIEFTEPQTLHISGTVESSFTSATKDDPKISGDKRQSGDAKGEQKESSPKYWLQERHIGEFSRVFNFPARLDKHQLSATMDGGILHMTIPKSSSHETYKVPIS